MTDSEKSSSPKSSAARRPMPRRHLAFGLVTALVLSGCMGAAYKVGFNRGETNQQKATKNTQAGDNPLLNLPASSTVTGVSKDKVTLTSPATGKKHTVVIDSKTKIINKDGVAKPGDITTGQRATVFTKKVNGKDVATQITLQDN